MPDELVGRKAGFWPRYAEAAGTERAESRAERSDGQHPKCYGWTGMANCTARLTRVRWMTNGGYRFLPVPGVRHRYLQIGAVSNRADYQYKAAQSTPFTPRAAR
ncbi:hypothetical protein KCP77_03630 [Salmonella enterica subsp. enterica]|nr:hypothetical protein KCP77_03630 [Salmonella enterica subsp. enterica]